jgi:hypothetical protein
MEVKYTPPFCCSWNGRLFAHPFLVIIQSAKPLIGRVTLTKMKANQISQNLPRHHNFLWYWRKSSTIYTF